MRQINELARAKGMTKQEYAKWYFADQGCELLDEYEHTMKKMRYRCRCGREAEVCWNKFTQRNRRCGFCGSNGRKKQHTLEEVKQIFQDNGCVLLESQYKNNHQLLRYQCTCGKEAFIPFSDFKNGQRCKDCGIIKQSGSNHWAWVADRAELRQRRMFRKKCYKALQSTLAATGQTKVGHTSDWIGYGPKELQEHIEAHPNWSKVKNMKWHLDHIFPIQAFLDYKITDARVINALDNLQPITQRENNIKKDRYDKGAFKAWLLTKNIVII